jgi:hypothetical protein
MTRKTGVHLGFGAELFLAATPRFSHHRYRFVKFDDVETGDEQINIRAAHDHRASRAPRSRTMDRCGPGWRLLLEDGWVIAFAQAFTHSPIHPFTH